MATKPVRVVTYNEKLPRIYSQYTKSFGPKRSSGKLKALYLRLQKTYDYQTR